MKKHTLLAAICMVIAVILAGYPIAGRILSEKYHADVVYTQAESVENTSRLDIMHAIDDADRYNRALANGLAMITNTERSAANQEYGSMLNVAGDGVMGTIEIPALGLSLPIAHGTESRTLEHYVGHVIGSSLPVGGQNTHAVLSGHSGLATDKMFSDLEMLNIGDYFVIHVLGMNLYYLVDQIEVVLPDDTSKLGIEQGKDYVTLVTCTPYGINTHRLLVRGERISEDEIPEVPVEQTGWTSKHTQNLLIVVGGAVFFLTACLIVRGRQK